MTNGRFAEILAEYANTMADIERPRTPAPPPEADNRVLKPADQQRACRPPRIAPTA